MRISTWLNAGDEYGATTWTSWQRIWDRDVEYPRAIWMPACALVEKHAQRASKYTTELFWFFVMNIHIY